MGEGQSAEEVFNKHFSKFVLMEDYHEDLQRMLQAQSKVTKINKARKEEKLPADEDVAVKEEGIKLIGEAKAAMHDVHDMECDTIGLSEHIRMLNEDQRRTFNRVIDHLLHQHQHECNECKYKELKPLYMFVSGVGETGQSFWIKSIRSHVDQKSHQRNLERFCW